MAAIMNSKFNPNVGILLPDELIQRVKALDIMSTMLDGKMHITLGEVVELICQNAEKQSAKIEMLETLLSSLTDKYPELILFKKDVDSL